MNAAAREALWLVEEFGAYVFPCAPGTKVPMNGLKWKEKSTNDPDKVAQVADHVTYADCNWAIDLEKSQMSALDVDNKKGISGSDTLKQLAPKFSSPLRVETPTEGFHYFMLGVIQNSVGKLGPGLDTRGYGGYVIVAGSVLDATDDYPGGTYKWVSKGKPAPVPDWLVTALGAVREKSPDRDNPITEEKPHHVEAAKAYLLGSAPEALQGDGGDHTTFAVACRVRDLGVEQDTALQLMLECWNDEKAHPPWSVAELATKVENAYRYASNPQGAATPEALFATPVSMASDDPDLADDEDDEEWESAAYATIDVIEPRDWVMGKRYLGGQVTVTAAPGGTGKSILTILEALAVATGRPLTGDTVVKPGAVLMHNQEDDRAELRRRSLAAKRHHGISDEESRLFRHRSTIMAPEVYMAYDTAGRPVVNEALVERTIRRIRRLGIVLYIVDPLASFHLVNENSNQEMQQFVGIFKRIAAATGCAMSLIHHTPKGSDARSRGNADMIRGGGAIVNAARVAHTLYPMTATEGRLFGVDPSRANWYNRLDNAKGNYSAPGPGLTWFEKISVPLRFDDDPTGTLQPVKLDAVVFDDGAEALRHSVVEKVAPGQSVSVYRLATDIADLGLVEGTSKTLQRRIKELLERPFQRDGLVWSLDTITSGSNKQIAAVTCKKEKAK